MYRSIDYRTMANYILTYMYAGTRYRVECNNLAEVEQAKDKALEQEREDMCETVLPLSEWADLLIEVIHEKSRSSDNIQDVINLAQTLDWVCKNERWIDGDTLYYLDDVYLELHEFKSEINFELVEPSLADES